MRMSRRLAREVSSSLSWRVAACGSASCGEDVFDHVPPSRETPTDREPLFRRPGRVPADLWNLLRHGFVPSSPIAVCFVWRQKIVHRTRAMPLSQAQTKVRKIPGVGGCGRFLGDNHAAIPWL